MGFNEYYQGEHVTYPRESSVKNSGYDGYGQHIKPEFPSFNNEQRWLISEAENISGSSDEKNIRVAHSNKNNHHIKNSEERKLQQRKQYYPSNNRERYFTNQDLKVHEDRELLTITVEIGNGEHEDIVIMNNDTAEDVADRFCDKYDMNEELRNIFTEQIANNIEQAKNELSYDQSYSEAHHEQVSTAIDNTSPVPGHNVQQYNDFYNENMANSNFRSTDNSHQDGMTSAKNLSEFSHQKHIASMSSKNSHTYTSPGPILINPNKNETLTIPKAKRGAKPKGSYSMASFKGSSTPNKPFVNSKSSAIISKKRYQKDKIHDRLYSEALNKQKILKRQNEKISGASYEASSVMNNSFNCPQSTQKRGRTLFEKAHTARNRTPTNYGEKMYHKGLKKIEENKRKYQKDKIEKEMQEYENLTFRPQINPVSTHFGRFNNKNLEDHLIDKGKKTQDMIDKKRSEILFEEQHRHSFKPQINKNSERIIMERSRQFLEESEAMNTSSISKSPMKSKNSDSSYMSANYKLDKFKLLYDDAIKRKQRKEEIYSK